MERRGSNVRDPLISTSSSSSVTPMEEEKEADELDLIGQDDALLTERNRVCCYDPKVKRFSFPFVSDLLSEHVRSRFLAITYPLLIFFFLSFWVYESFSGTLGSDGSDSSSGSETASHFFKKVLKSSSVGVFFFLPGIVHNSVYQSNWLIIPSLISNCLFLGGYVLITFYFNDDFASLLADDPFLATIFSCILFGLVLVCLRTLWGFVEIYQHRKLRSGKPVHWLWQTFREERYITALCHVKKLLCKLTDDHINPKQVCGSPSDEQPVFKYTRAQLREIYQIKCQTRQDIYIPTRFILGISFSESAFKDESDMLTLTRVIFALALSSCYFSAFVILINIIFMVFKYRRTIFNMRIGVYEFEPGSFGVTSATNYIGYQTIHTLACYWFLTILLTIISAALFTLFYFEQARQLFFRLLLHVFTGFILTAVATFVVNYILNNCVYSSHQRQVVNNRRLFSLYDFGQIFAQLSLGVFGTIKNILVIEGVVLFTFMRLDLPKAPRRIESWDSGYSSWCSMVKLDHTYTNPIGIVFLRKIREVGSGSRWPSDKKWIRNKWWLLVVLAKNPSLIKYRKHNLEKLGEDSAGLLNNITNVLSPKLKKLKKVTTSPVF